MTMRGLLVFVILFMAPPVYAVDAREIGRMKITVMPEYDTQAVLVIEEGKFLNSGLFPAEVTFNLPREVIRLTDVCSLSPGGHHFCQIFKLKSRDEKTWIDIKLPFTDFFIDYQYAPFTVKPHQERSFVYTINPVYDIKTLEVLIQKPARSRDFSVEPGEGELIEKDGFSYLKKIYKNIKAGVKIPVTVRYYKEGVEPSVDEKYTAMRTPDIFTGYSGEILLLGGVVFLGGFWLWRRRVKKGQSS